MKAHEREVANLDRLIKRYQEEIQLNALKVKGAYDLVDTLFSYFESPGIGSWEDSKWFDVWIYQCRLNAVDLILPHGWEDGLLLKEALDQCCDRRELLLNGPRRRERREAKESNDS